MTLQRVELYRVDPQYDEVHVGEGVRAQTFEAAARLQQWVRGRGRLLVPFHHPRYTVATSVTSTLRYWTAPSGVALARVWLLDVRASVKTAATTVTVEVPGFGPIDTYTLSGRSADSCPIVYIESGVSQTTTPGELTIEVTAVRGTARIESVSCYELPRCALDCDASLDFGVLVDSFYPRRDVYEDASAIAGLYGLAVSVENTDTRRIGHVSMWHDVGFSTTSALFEDVYPVRIPVVPAQDRVADTTRLLQVAAYGLASDMTTEGTLRIADTVGNTSAVISIPAGSTTGAWRGVAELAFLCEDLTKPDGRRAGAETVQVQIRRTAGVGTITWKGWNVYEKFV